MLLAWQDTASGIHRCRAAVTQFPNISRPLTDGLYFNITVCFCQEVLLIFLKNAKKADGGFKKVRKLGSFIA